ncbi:MAG TPA: CdaR family protein [Candidatus Atribacteria bacterium]|nr:CdaR family protein [Candidatus Atribacteria bacterium]
MNKLKLFERNGAIKVLSVVIAFILWLYAVSELNPEATKSITDIPIIVQNADELWNKGLTLAKDPPAKTSIRIRGLGNDISKVNLNNIKAILDLSVIENEGIQQIPLDIEGLTPREVRLDSIPEVSVVINRIANKIIPVNIRYVGAQPKDYYIHEATADPRNITIVGAESIVNSVVKAVVEVNLENAKEKLELSLPISLYDASDKKVEPKYIEMLQKFVMVTVPIYPLKTLPVSATITGEPAVGFVVRSVKVEPEKIVVNGDPSVISKLEKLTTEVIDITGKNGDINVNIPIEAIPGVFFDTGKVRNVNVKVDIEEQTVERSFELKNISLVNLPEGYDAELVTHTVTVTLSGRYSAINKLEVDSLKPVVDLKGLTEGEHLVEVRLDLPAGLQRIESSPPKVMVRLKAATTPSPEPTEAPVTSPTPSIPSAG